MTTPLTAPDEEMQILRYLCCTVGDIMKHTGSDLESIKKLLYSLKQKGHVEITEIPGPGFNHGTRCWITDRGRSVEGYS
jgi:DNA-binding MarR family transcriptional regulator